MEYIKHLARIENVQFGIEDHGMLHFNLDLHYETGGMQGTGLIVDGPNGSALIKAIFQVVAPYGDISDLVGKTVYALKEKDKSWDYILGLETGPWSGRTKRVIFAEVA